MMESEGKFESKRMACLWVIFRIKTLEDCLIKNK